MLEMLERNTILGPFPLPAVDEALRERARRLAGAERWLTVEDPGAPPEQEEKTKTQGGYEISETGELTGEYMINALYRPSEQVAGMPLTMVDLWVWRALNGYNPAGLLVDTLDRAELALYAEYPGDTRLLVTRDTDDQPVLPAFTSSRHLPASWTHHHQLVPGWTILDQFGDGPVLLDLNAGTSLALKIMIRDLASLLTERSRQGRDLEPLRFDMES